MHTSEDVPATQEKGSRVDDLHLAFVADKETVRRHAQWRDPGITAHWDVANTSPSGGVDTSISAWAVDQCNMALGQEPTVVGNGTHAALVKAAQDCEPGAWERFNVLESVRVRDPPKAI